MKMSYLYPSMMLDIGGLFISISNLIFKKILCNFIWEMNKDELRKAAILKPENPDKA